MKNMVVPCRKSSFSRPKIKKKIKPTTLEREREMCCLQPTHNWLHVTSGFVESQRQEGLGQWRVVGDLNFAHVGPLWFVVDSLGWHFKCVIYCFL